MVKPSNSAPQTLKVLVLNAENLFIFLERWDGTAMSEMTEVKWQLANAGMLDNKPLQKTRDLAFTLNSIDPDLIFMTEVGGLKSLENFNEHFLKSKWKCHLLEGNSDRGIDMGYLVRGDWEVEIKSRRELILPHPKYTKFSRDVLSLEMRLNGKLWFNTLLVHLKSKLDKNREDFEGRTRRAVEVHGLAEIISGFDPNIPLLLGGDFNGDARWPNPEPEFLPLYHRSNLKDAVALSNIPEEERFSYLYFRTSVQGRIAQQLDYLFLNEAAQKILIQDSVVFARYLNSEGMALPVPVEQAQRKLLPSDHFPLYAEFDLSQHPNY
ncbi:MAG: hypothetical protein K2P81_13550 [Bacteriovoracaceae bacterium]|nr:hypothetical protein [Bacteriovoracaceae bacterium]